MPTPTGAFALRTRADVASWGLDNRSAAVRVITSNKPATRIEHRVAGADTNPYLVLAMILGAALTGMNKRIDPGEATAGEDHEASHDFPTNWDYSLHRFSRNPNSPPLRSGPNYQALYTACKQQELEEFSLRVTDVEYDAYIKTV